MNSINPDYFIHICNILMLVAYSVRDILKLRLFAVAASLIAIPYFVLQPTPLWAPLSWSALFAAINGYQAWRLYLERRPVQLTPEEEHVRRLAFRDLPARKFLELTNIGRWVDVEPGERMIERGKPVETIALIVRGRVRVKKDEHVLGDLAAGDIAGSALMMSGAAAEVDATTVETVRAMRWEVATLERYLGANPETRLILQKHLARDLTGKLQRLGNVLLGEEKKSETQE